QALAHDILRLRVSTLEQEQPGLTLPPGILPVGEQFAQLSDIARWAGCANPLNGSSFRGGSALLLAVCGSLRRSQRERTRGEAAQSHQERLDDWHGLASFQL